MKRSRLFSFLLFIALAVSSLWGITPSYAQGDSTKFDAIVAQIPDLVNLANQAPGTFVGEVEASYAYIAFVVQDNLAVIYVCDSVGVSAWIKAEVANGVIQATDEKSGVQINANVAAEAITGTVTLTTDDDGTPSASHKFTTAPAVPGKTGLARLADENQVSGWIVTEHGMRGVRKFLDCQGYKRQVATIRNLFNSTSDAGVRTQLANQYTTVALEATIAGCGDVTQ